MGNRICIRCKFSFKGTKKDNLCPDCQRELLEEIRKEKLKKTFDKIDEKIDKRSVKNKKYGWRCISN